MYAYTKALHIIFIVTWFAAMFYIVRLFVYNTEAGEKPEPARSILRAQFGVMIKRLWTIIGWPSAMLTLVLGPFLWWQMGSTPSWLAVKLGFVAGLYLYHLSLHAIYRQQLRGEFRYSSQKLRLWNEVATLLLFAIVFTVSVKQAMSWLWGLLGLVSLGIVLMIATRLYKRRRASVAAKK